METNQTIDSSVPIPNGDFLDIRKPEFDVQTAVGIITSDIKEGRVQPMKGAVILKRMEKIVEEVKKDAVVKQMILNDATKYLSGNQKSFDFMGCRIIKGANYTWYDFSGCGHPEYDALVKIAEYAKARMEQIEDELKLLIPKKGGKLFGIPSSNKTIVVENIPVITNEPSGEVATVEAPRKMQDEGLKFMRV